MTLRLARLVALALACAAALAVPPADRDFAPLEAAAKQLAKSGRAEELAETLEILAALGYPSAKSVKLRATCEADAAKVKARPPSAPDAARAVRAAARALARALPAAASPEKEELARRILQLDASIEEAHVALGDEKADGHWIAAEERAMRARRAEIQELLRQARRLPIAIDVGESSHPMLLAAHGAKGVVAKHGKHEVHSPWSAEKTTRMLRESLRALALSNALVRGKLEVPDERNVPRVFVADKAALLKAVEASLEAKGTDEKVAGMVKTSSLSMYRDSRGYDVAWTQMENAAESSMFLNWGNDLRYYPPGVRAGHVNWVALAYLGASIPSLIWRDANGSGAPPQTTTDLSEAERKKREEVLRLANAGIAGCRSWMAYLAARREDPAWANSILDDVAKIVGDPLLKTTSVLEMLQERGLLAPQIARLRAPTVEQAAKLGPPDFEKALGESMQAIDARWRRWILAGTGSLAERLEKKEGARTKAEEELLAALKSVRARAGIEEIRDARAEVDLEPSLSEGARLHSLYLAKHPEQQAAWPDAHEEYPDREGFTTEGAWAGGHAVIAPGTSTPQQAVDGWMGTFYHRLPLLEPGCLRVGWSQEKNVAVLDASSLSRPTPIEWEVAWPPDGMTGVPTRFAPELPNPVPQEDESEFGYPITLQLGIPSREAPQHDVRMTLHEGSSSGREVPCWFSTPLKPTNPDLAPAGAFCLIPKAPLKAKTTYVVVAEWIGVAKTKSWSFKT